MLVCFFIINFSLHSFLFYFCIPFFFIFILLFCSLLAIFSAFSFPVPLKLWLFSSCHLSTLSMPVVFFICLMCFAISVFLSISLFHTLPPHSHSAFFFLTSFSLHSFFFFSSSFTSLPISLPPLLLFQTDGSMVIRKKGSFKIYN